MAIDYIDAKLLKEMIIAGASYLEKNKNVVDDLNVFPVPDGDTGTNMSLTMKSCVKELKKLSEAELNITSIMESVSNGALMGARGNSGVILSQLLRGFYKSIENKEKLYIKDLAEAFKLASDTAYKAVMRPVEGTILTVARESAEYAIKNYEKQDDIEVFFRKVIQAAEVSLKSTPELLDVLKEAGVVDSGGKGYVYILLGFYSAIKGETFTSEDIDIIESKVEHKVRSSEDIKFGYCTEFIIKGSNISVDGIKEKFNDLGDSTLVVGSEKLVKIHIHTNNPGIALNIGQEYGIITDIKIDNMREQYLVKEEKEEKYGFITVSMGDGLDSIFEKFNINKIIKGGQTMNPSTEDFLNAIDEINAENIFILPNNSNIIMAANQAKEISKKNIIVIPSKSIPAGISSLIGFNADVEWKENESNMLSILETVVTGQVTYSVRDTTFKGKKIKKDDIMGIGNSEIKSVGNSVEEVLIELIEELIDEDKEILTLYYGEDIKKEQAESISEKLEDKFEDLEVEIYSGGQPIYYYLFSLE